MKHSDGSEFIFNDNREAFVNEMRRKADVILEKIGIHIEGEAKEELENTPRRIDTGLLRNSITYAVSGKPAAIRSYHADKANSKYSKGKKEGQRRSASAKNAGSVNVGFYNGTAPEDPLDSKCVYVGTNVYYAIYVHEGTVRMTPNRYLKNACVRNTPQIKRFIKSELKKGEDPEGAFKGLNGKLIDE